MKVILAHDASAENAAVAPKEKTIVFGLLKRGDKVYTEIVPNCKSATLQKIIKGKTDVDSVIHSDGWRGYNGLVDFGYKKHFRVHHGKNEFVRGFGVINLDSIITSKIFTEFCLEFLEKSL